MTEEACKIESPVTGSFEELVEEMSGDMYWYRFFARPCCPAPNVEGAVGMLDKLAGDVDRSDFDDAQKAELKRIIEERKAWYPTSGLCRSGN